MHPSLSARRVWIEIISIASCSGGSGRHSLRGECGLKLGNMLFGQVLNQVTLCEESVD